MHMIQEWISQQSETYSWCILNWLVSLTTIEKNSFASSSHKLGKMEENVIKQKHCMSWSVVCRNILK